MATHYCHSCGAARGLVGRMPEGDPIGTQYQLKKYMKHTVPDARYNIQSVFNSTSTQAYAGYIVESMTAGSVAVDHRGTSVTWCAGEPTGFLYERGVLKMPEDGVKVVLSTSTGQMHAYPVAAQPIRLETCADCGRPALS